ncbi:MAG: thrombospondin type 3 repeat-containing protein [Opitutaceae bacterium]|nr:thrombospondin type 3 repeat-containing protein [Opitutaceae bacterium]
MRNNLRSYFILMSLCAASALAAPPVITGCQVTSVVAGGGPLVFQVTAQDPGGIKSITVALTKVDPPALQYALSPVTWYATTPYSVNLTQNVNFAVSTVGNYAARVTVTNVGNESAYVERPAYVFVESRSLNGSTVTGKLLEVADGELVSPGTGTMSLSSGSDVTYGASGRIVLKPGFSALQGSAFYAIIADLTETGDFDSDGDGIADAKEGIIGTNPHIADSDGDGMSDGTEFFLGTNPLSPIEVAAPPSGFGTTFDLVLRTPSTNYGVKRTDWSILVVP